MKEAPITIDNKTLVLLCMICFIEGADTSLYGSCLRAWEVTLGMKLSSLGTLEMVGGLSAAVSGPIWALLCDSNVIKRKTLIVWGSFLWGFISLCISRFSTLGPMFACRILVSCMLSSVMPITQSIIADISVPETRGRYFALVGASVTIGIMTCQVASTGISNKEFYGVDGWRISFVFVGFASMLLSCSFARFGHIPEESLAKDLARGTIDSLKDACQEMLLLLKVRSFVVIVVQGLFGMVAFKSMHFIVMWYQYSGMTDIQAGFLSSLCQFGGIIGIVAGGFVGDLLSSWSRWHGRQIMASMTVICSVPILALLFSPSVLFNMSSSFAYMTPFVFGIGLSTSWTVSGCNRPVLADIAAGAKASTMALDWACETAFGSIIAPLIVTSASVMLGYKSTTLQVSEMTVEQRQANVVALGTSIWVITTVCYFTCALSYNILHWTYQQDAERCAANKETQALLPGKLR